VPDVHAAGGGGDTARPTNWGRGLPRSRREGGAAWPV